MVSNVTSLTSSSVQFLSECVVGAPVGPDGEMEAEEEEEEEGRVLSHRSGARAFHLVGTVSDTFAEDRSHVLEEYMVRTVKLSPASCK